MRELMKIEEKTEKSNEKRTGKGNFISRSIRKKLLFVTLSLTLLSILIISVIFLEIARGELKYDAFSQLGGIADSRATTIEKYLQLRQEQAKLISGTFLLRQLVPNGENDPQLIEQIQNHIDSIYVEMKIDPNSGYKEIDKTTDIEIISILDVNGVIIANTEKDLIGQKIPSRLLDGVKERDTFFGGFIADTLTEENFLIILKGIRNWGTNEFSGVVSLKSSASTLNEILQKRIGLDITGETYLINQDHFVISPLLYHEDPILKLIIDSEIVLDCFEGKERSMLYPDYRGVPIIGVSRYLEDLNWCMLSEIDEEEAFLPIYNLEQIVTLIAGILAVGVTGVSLLVSNSITRPLIKLKMVMNEIAKENYTVKISPSGHDEIYELMKSSEKMVRYLKQSKTLTDETIEKIQRKTDELTDFKNALDESSIVAIADNKGDITYVNNKFCEISKYSREELIGQNRLIHKSGYHPDAFYTRIWNVITDSHVWRGDIKNKAKDGSYYWVRTTIVPLLGNDGKPEQYIAISTDITNQKESEEKLANAVEELKESEKLKEEFTTMISHELKTPLTPIKFQCEMLSEGGVLGELNTEQKNSVKEIERNAVRLERLVKDMLDVQKLDMEKMIFNMEKFNLGKFLEKLEKNLSHLMTDKKIELVIKNSLNKAVTSDEYRLQQVIDNLVKNAVDAVPEKTGRIEIGTQVEDSRIIFYVKDNGIGISKKNQKNLFKKFYQVDTSHTRKHGGTGLGLAVCKGLIEGLGGKIWLESEKGKGTAFYFSIPIIKEKIKVKS